MPKTKSATEKLSVVFMCKMTRAMRKHVIKRATKEGCSASAVIRKAISVYLDDQRGRDDT